MKITESLKRVSHASILLAAFYVVKMLFSVLLRSSIAKFFGAEGITDAYFAALTVPRLIGDFLIGGIVFSIIIPVFQQRKENVGEENAFDDVSGLLNLSALFLFIVTLIYFLLIPVVIPLMFPGFKGETLAYALKFARWFSPAMLLMGISLIYAAFYHVHRDFHTPCIAMLCYPVISLFALWLLPVEWGIERLVIANVIGYLAGFLILAILIRDKIRWKWHWSLKNPLLITTFALAWPLLIADFLGKIIALIQKGAASCVAQGSLTLLDNSLYLIGSVIAVTAGPISTAVFPLLGEQKAKGNKKLFFNTFNKALNAILFLTIPCCVLLLAQGPNIVSIIFGYGKFSIEDQKVCSELIFILAFSIIPICLSHVIFKYFLVYQMTLGYSILNIVVALCILPFYFIAAKKFGLHGIAFVALSLKSVIALAEILYLKIRHADFSIKRLFFGFFKLYIAGSLMYAMMMLTNSSVQFIEYAIVQLAICSLLGGIIYFMATFFMNVKGLETVVGRLPFVGKYVEKFWFNSSLEE